MVLKYIEKDIFTLNDSEYHFVHCVAADIGWDAKSGTQGIAKVFNEKYMIKDLINMFGITPIVGEAIKTDCVFNLITKARYFYKPTYDSMKRSLYGLKDLLRTNNIDRIAMPYIGTGLDKLEWKIVEGIIKEVFEDTPFLEILVCKKPQ